MEQVPEQNSLFGLNIDDPVRNHLYETAKWGKFLAIIGFIVCGLIILAGIFMGTLFTKLPGTNRGRYDMDAEAMAGFEGMGAMMAVIYIIIALLYFFPCLFLLRFSSQMKSALSSNNQEMMTSSFKNLKVLFRFIGVLTIIFLAFYALILVGAALSF